MGSLQPVRPCGSSLPFTAGTVTLSEVDLGRLTLVMPFKGHHGEVSLRLTESYGAALPPPNQSVTTEKARIIWFGRDSYLIVGAEAVSFGDAAAATDQSDAWACVELSGEHVETVLARLVPVDLRSTVFGNGASVRTLLGHMTASLTRVGPESILLMVYRSMADSLVKELKVAMEAVAARG